MSNIVAGIGRGQLKVIRPKNKKKTDIYKQYKEAFKQIPDIEMQPTPVNTVPNHWLSVITLKADSKNKTTRHNGSIRKRKHRIKTSMETNAYAASICKMRFHKK